ncbi:hypothetical protein UP12_19220 (plasmid) [Bacillus pumilus]|uniref:hypothetical protein n=1 Tax=Bacillus pumilus TaxID=1408 RepID=UPI0007765142|nr:hypothetical protein [Bacillus pumilus]AMM99547.1 hypothetical protein UP12_19220 [Bacillus pumilus]
MNNSLICGPLQGIENDNLKLWLSKTFFNFFSELNRCMRGEVSESRFETVKQQVLDSFVSKRKGLSIKEIKDRGFDIYKKRTNSIDQLLAAAYSMGLLEEIENIFPEKTITLTQKGINFLEVEYTNNYSEEFRLFEEQLKNEMLKVDGLPLDDFLVKELFFDHHSVETIMRIYDSESNELVKRTKRYHHQLRESLGIALKENEYCFYFQPSLLLPTSMAGLHGHTVKLRLEYDGEGLHGIQTSTPFPNKRWVYADFIPDNSKQVFGGIYPIVANKNQFPKTMVVQLEWQIRDNNDKIRLLINERVKCNFTFSPYGGRLFSNVQNLSRSSPIKTVNDFTDAEKVILNRSPNPKINAFDKYLYLEYNNEKEISLTNFPEHLHSVSYIYNAERNKLI